MYSHICSSRNEDLLTLNAEMIGFNKKPLNILIDLYIVRNSEVSTSHHPSLRKSKLGVWSSGMIRASGVRGRGFDSPNSPFPRQGLISLTICGEQSGLWQCNAIADCHHCFHTSVST